MVAFGCLLQLFRGPILERIAHGTHRPVFHELIDYFSFESAPPISAKLSEWYPYLYDVLLEKYRCEYVYKNSIAQQLYLLEHPNPKKALLTDEFNIGQSRADVVVINDTSTVYEIKSEFDSFSRLEAQLLDYSRVFDKIYLVTTEHKYKEFSKINSSIGFYVMDDDGSLHRIKEAPSNKHNTDPGAIFSCMRKTEYIPAIKEIFGYVPDVPNGIIWRECYNIFKDLSPEEAHRLLVSYTVRRSAKKPFMDFINDVPESLLYTCLASNRHKRIVPRFMEALEKPLLEF